jgi:hypothetical protein
LANGKGYARETTDHIERVTLTEDKWYRMKEGRRSIDLPFTLRNMYKYEEI